MTESCFLWFWLQLGLLCAFLTTSDLYVFKLFRFGNENCQIISNATLWLLIQSIFSSPSHSTQLCASSFQSVLIIFIFLHFLFSTIRCVQPHPTRSSHPIPSHPSTVWHPFDLISMYEWPTGYWQHESRLVCLSPTQLATITMPDDIPRHRIVPQYTIQYNTRRYTTT